MPGESTLRRDFLRLQLATNDALRRQQQEQQQNEEHKRQLLAERQKRIEEQKEQRRRLEDQQRRERDLRKQQEREQRRRYEEMEQLRRDEERRHAEREQEYIRRQLEEEQRQLEILQQQLLQEQALLLEYKRKQIEEQRQAERLQRQLQQERAYLVSLQQQQQQEGRPADKKQLYHYKDSVNPTDKPAWAKEVLKQRPKSNPPIQHQSFNQPAAPAAYQPHPRARIPRPGPSQSPYPPQPPPHIRVSLETRDPLDPGLKREISLQVREMRAQRGRRQGPKEPKEPNEPKGPKEPKNPKSECRQQAGPRQWLYPATEQDASQGPDKPQGPPPGPGSVSAAKLVEERSKLNRQSSPALQHKMSNRAPDPSLPPRSESFSSGGMQPPFTPPMIRSVEPQMAHLVPVRTHSSMSGSQSLQDQTGSALGEVTAMGSPRPEMPPRQNSDPTSDTPTPPPRVASRDERDRTAWLRDEAMPPKVPQRTTSISPALVRKNSPNGGLGLGLRTGGQLIRASNPDLRRSELSLDAALQRTSSNSSSSSSPSSQGGSAERKGQAQQEVSPTGANQEAKPKQEEGRESARPSRPASYKKAIDEDLSALAKELRELRVEEGNRPPAKVTDYSSSSNESESSDEDGETVGHDGTVAVSDIPRIMPAVQGSSETYRGLAEDSLGDTYNNSKDSTLMMREAEERRRGGHSESNGFGNHGNHGNLPDLVQQSHSPSATPTSALQELSDLAEFGLGGSKASFTPFVDPRVYQTSPNDEDDEDNSAADMFANELLRQEQARLNEARKISVVNVNPTNIRPHSDTPEIRKYKKRFNSEILCAALWGVNLLVGTENGLMLLDRSGQGKVYNLITRRRFQQMEVLEGLNVLVTISGKKNKLRVYYLSWLRNRILHNDPEVEKKQGWITVGELEGCVHYKVVKYERIKFLVIALKNSVEIYAWAPKPYHKFMAFKSFTDLQHRPQLVDLTVEEGQRLKVIYGSSVGFHVIDVDSGNPYDIYIPSHIQSQVTPHAIVVLPKTDGMEMLLCYEDEGVYVNTYGRITKDVVLQWGEMPTSVAYIHSNQIMGWGEKAIEIRSVETGHLDGVFMHKRAQRLKFLCERNDKVFFASVRSGGSSQVFFMTLNRNSMMNW
ncbi:TRAF2 and NCK interacting kinase a isoform X2 [Osmerus eperlanus]|uniref:TRAF2 and NCK interacting kinase a isoform X2 n=1 Tax=Osmerus eperlanus TaxID=29151 RepID=UPI002E0D9D3C